VKKGGKDQIAGKTYPEDAVTERSVGSPSTMEELAAWRVSGRVVIVGARAT
jgi:hypothetical protein